MASMGDDGSVADPSRRGARTSSTNWHSSVNRAPSRVLASPLRGPSALAATESRLRQQRLFFSEALDVDAAAQAQRVAQPRARLRRASHHTPLREPHASLFVEQRGHEYDAAVGVGADGVDAAAASTRARAFPLRVADAESRPARFPGFFAKAVLGEPRQERLPDAERDWCDATTRAPPKMLGGERGAPLSVLRGRRARAYAAVDLSERIDLDGITADSLSAHFIPLDAFDDVELEARTAEDWFGFGAAIGTSLDGGAGGGLGDGGGAAGEPARSVLITLMDADGHAADGARPSPKLALRARCLPDTRDARGRWAAEQLEFLDASVVEWVSDVAHVCVAQADAEPAADSATDHAARAHARRNGTPMLRVRWKAPRPTGSLFGCPFEEERWLPRVHCHIFGEDPALFARRLAGAHRARARAERALGLALFADQMDSETLSPIPSYVLYRALGRVNARFASGALVPLEQVETPPLARDLFAEIGVEYLRAQNALALRHELLAGRVALPAWMALPDEASLPTDARIARAGAHARARAGLLERPEQPARALVNADPLPPSASVVGGVVLAADAMRAVRGEAERRRPGPVALPPGANVAAARQQFKLATMLLSEPALRALSLSHHENARALGAVQMSATALAWRTLELHEFETQQLSTQRLAEATMREAWASAQRRLVGGALAAERKGYFNLHAMHAQAWPDSKLARLFRVVDLMMESTILELRALGAQQYLALIQGHARARVEVRSATIVLNSAPLASGGSGGGGAARARRGGHEAVAAPALEPAPLFAIDLHVTKAPAPEPLAASAQQPAQARRAGGATRPPSAAPAAPTPFGFTPRIEAFRATCVGLFEGSLPRLRGLPSIGPPLLPHLRPYLLGGPDLIAPDASDREQMAATLAALGVALDAMAVHLQAYAAAFSAEYARDAALDPAARVRALADERSSALVAMAEEHLARAAVLHAEVPSAVRVGAFQVRLSSARAELAARHEHAATGILSLIGRSILGLAEDASDECAALVGRLAAEVTNAEVLRAIEAEIAAAPVLLEEVGRTLAEMSESAAHLERLYSPLTDKQSLAYWAALRWPSRLRELLGEAAQRLTAAEAQLVVQLAEAQDALRRDIAGLSRAVKELMAQPSTLADTHGVAISVRERFAQLDELVARLGELGAQEATLSLPVTEHAELGRLQARFKPYSTLWSAAARWVDGERRFMSCALEFVSPADVEALVAATARDVLAVGAIYRSALEQGAQSSAETSIVDELQERLDAFRPCMPLVEMLCGPAMREHHWRSISELIGWAIRPTTTLSELIAAGALERRSAHTLLAALSDVQREYEVELLVAEIESEHEHQMRYALVWPFGAEQPASLGNAEELALWLDDQAARIDGVAHTPERARFAQRLDAARAVVESTSRVFAAFTRWMRVWLFLQPIFTDEDVNVCMPSELVAFNKMDAYWRVAVRKAADFGLLVKHCQTNGLLAHATMAYETLETIQHGLSRYLADKRAAFPRFHLLADAELFHLIAAGIQPQRLQQYFHKMLPAVNRVIFQRMLDTDALGAAREAARPGEGRAAEPLSLDARHAPPAAGRPSLPPAPLPPIRADGGAAAGKDAIGRRTRRGSSEAAESAMAAKLEGVRTMVALESFEGEILSLSAPVVAAGPIQNWMAALERAMLAAIHLAVDDALKLYSALPAGRVAWALRGSSGLAVLKQGGRRSVAQATVLASQLVWTSTVGDALAGGGGPALQSLRFKTQLQLLELSRTLRGPRALAERAALAALLISDVHARDVLSGLLDERVSSRSEFGWLRVLRAYVGPAEGAAAVFADDPNQDAGPMAVSAPPAPRDAATPAVAPAPLTATDLVKTGARARARAHARARPIALTESLCDVLGIVKAEADGKKGMSQMMGTLSKNLAFLRAEPALVQATVSLAQLDASFTYGYEYLGAAARLVVTPLTERVALTATQALSLKLGVAIAGPAGVGKTETAKDLSRAFGRLSIVFNCAGTLSLSSLTRLFRSVASTGAWACLDELNCVPVEVLSVFAQQVLSLQRGLRVDQPTFVLDGESCFLQPTAVIFATLNPPNAGAGRFELPRSLSALFRPVAMALPHVDVIGEIRLYAAGYVSARQLAAKMNATLDLLAGVVADRSHYDFSLRTTIAVVDAAGRLRQAAPDEVEEPLLLRALRETLGPRLAAYDAILFRRVLAGVWPDAAAGANDAAAAADAAPADEGAAVALVAEAGAPAPAPAPAAPAEPVDGLCLLVERAATSLGLIASAPFARKAVELFQLLEHRAGVLLLGGAGLGKSCLLDALAGALALPGAPPAVPRADAAANRRATRRSMDMNPAPSDAGGEEARDAPLDAGRVVLTRCNPKAHPLSDLFGHYVKAPAEATSVSALRHAIGGGGPGVWVDGLFSQLLRAATDAQLQGGSQARRWLVLDGPLDAQWVETLNTVLDDTRKLTLSSQETVELASLTHLIFETDVVGGASPATVSRCAVVFLEPAACVVPLELRVRAWAAALPAAAALAAVAWLEPLVGSVLDALPPALDWLAGGVGALPDESAAVLAAAAAVASGRERELVPRPAELHAAAFLNLLAALLRPYLLGRPEDAPLAGGQARDVIDARAVVPRVLPVVHRALILQALTWSVGAAGSAAARASFDRWARRLAKWWKLSPALPVIGSVHDVFLEISGSPPGTRSELELETMASRGAPPADAPSGAAPDGRDVATDSEAALAPRLRMRDRLEARRRSAIITARPLRVRWLRWEDGADVAPSLGASARGALELPGGRQHADHSRPFRQPQVSFAEILVPTVETVRVSWLMRALATSGRSVALVGLAGCGKTLLCRDGDVLRRLAAAGTKPASYFLGANTRVDDLRAFLERNLVGARADGGGALAPPHGARALSILLDDLNLVKPVTAWGACPPLELVRQWLGSHGWYSRGAGSLGWSWRPVERAHARATFAPAGGGRYQLSARLLRHFHVLAMPPLDDATMESIYTPALTAPDARALAPQLVRATIALYRALADRLRPSVDLPQYAFNPRDISRTLQGISSIAPSALARRGCALRLWWHECCRVFGDRLENATDLHSFRALCLPIVADHFGDEALEDLPLRARADGGLPVDPAEVDAEPPLVFVDFYAFDTAAEFGLGVGSGIVRSRRRSTGRRRSTMTGVRASLTESSSGRLARRSLVSRTLSRKSIASSGGHMFAGKQPNGAGALHASNYSEVADMDKLQGATAAFLAEYNMAVREALDARAAAVANAADNEDELRKLRALPSVGSPRLDVVLFSEMLATVAQLHRVLSTPCGHMLLLGAAGSGRSSLVRLAAFIAEAAVVAPLASAAYTMGAWRLDLRDALLAAGEADEQVVLLIDETSLDLLDGEHGILADVDELLNGGRVAGLLSETDEQGVADAMRKILLDEAEAVAMRRLAARAARNGPRGPGFHAATTPTVTNDDDDDDDDEPALSTLTVDASELVVAHSADALWLQRVRSNLHVVLLMTPHSRAFRARLREFPSLTNFCAINHVQPWSADALVDVAEHELCEVELGPELERQCVRRACAELHMCAASAAEDERLGGASYAHTSGKHYIEMLRAIAGTILSKRTELLVQRARLRNGLGRIQAAARAVEALQAELAEAEPVVLSKTGELEQVTAQMLAESEAVREARQVALREEALAALKVQEARDLKASAEADLAATLPMLEDALGALKALSIADVLEVARYAMPPNRVKAVLEAVAILFHAPPPRKGTSDHELWELGRRMLQDAKALLDAMLAYKFEALTAETMARLAVYIDDPEFVPGKVATASRACAAMCGWVRAMDCFFVVQEGTVKPKRARLHEIELETVALQANCETLQRSLERIEQQIRDLHALREATLVEREALKLNAIVLGVRVGRAERLMRGLHGEDERWLAEFERSQLAESRLVGDVLLWAATVSHIGVFGAREREALRREWAYVLRSNGLALSAESERLFATDMLTLRHMHARGLPKDPVSVENAMILEHRKRTPLMVDPQMQANGWLKRMHGGISSSRLARLRAELVKERKAYPAAADAPVAAADADAHGAAAAEAAAGRAADRARGELDVLTLADHNAARRVEAALGAGRIVLIEDLTADDLARGVDNLVAPLVKRQTSRSADGNEMVVLTLERTHDKALTSAAVWHPDFELLLTTKLERPALRADLYSYLTFLNFTVTHEGLEAQFLAMVVQAEAPAVTADISAIELANLRARNELVGLQERVLSRLRECEGDLLDDDKVLELINRTRDAAAALRLVAAREASRRDELETVRVRYRAVAARCTALFLALRSMRAVLSSYAWNLDWFRRAVAAALDAAAVGALVATTTASGGGGGDARAPDARASALGDAVLARVWTGCSPGLLHRHRLTCAALLASRAQLLDARMLPAEWHYLIAPPSTARDKRAPPPPPPAVHWLAPRAWAEICALSALNVRKTDARLGGAHGAHFAAAAAAAAAKPPPRLSQTVAPSAVAPSAVDALFGGSVAVAAAVAAAAAEAAALAAEAAARAPPPPPWTRVAGGPSPELPFAGLAEHMMAEPAAWEPICRQPNGHARALPPPWDATLTYAQRLCVLRALHPERLVELLRGLVEFELGVEIAQTTQLPLDKAATLAQPHEPILLLTAADADPVRELQRLCDRERGARTLRIVSLGRGQHLAAERALRAAGEAGDWLVLLNTHLAADWFSHLEALIVEQAERLRLQAGEATGAQPRRAPARQLGDVKYGGRSSMAGPAPPPLKVRAGYRLWLTADPALPPPPSLLELCFKFAYEPPSGVRASLAASLGALSPGWLRAHAPDARSLRLAYSLCLHHALSAERPLFGAIGLSQPLPADEVDLECSLRLLERLVEPARAAPARMLRQLIADTTYGGRVHSPWDMRAILCAFDDAVLAPVAEADRAAGLLPLGATEAGPDASAAPELRRLLPPLEALEARDAADGAAAVASLVAFADGLSDTDAPALFGLPASAALARAERDGRRRLAELYRAEMPGLGASGAPAAGRGAAARGVSGFWAGGAFETGLSARPREALLRALDQASADADGLRALCAELLDQLGRELAPLPTAEVDARVAAEACEETDADLFDEVLHQESFRFNRLLETVRTTLVEMTDALDGTVLMSDELEQAAVAIAANRVPSAWATLSFLSLAPLSRWLRELRDRLAFFRGWIEHGRPPAFWLSAFFNPHALLGSALYFASLTLGTPLDALAFECGFGAPARVVELARRAPDAPVAGGTAAGSAADASRPELADAAADGREAARARLDLALAAGGAANEAAEPSAPPRALDACAPPELDARAASVLYVYGLSLEGARWDAVRGCIVDLEPTQAHAALPVLALRPVERRPVPLVGVYVCPLYKVVSRADSLTASGRVVSNFVTYLELPSGEAAAEGAGSGGRDGALRGAQLPHSHTLAPRWIQRGVAAFLSVPS